MPRVLNTPADILNYPDNMCVYRSVNFNSMPKHPQAPVPNVGGRVVEATWGTVYERDESGVETEVVLYGPESVSFAETAEGGWNKSTSLRLD